MQPFQPNLAAERELSDPLLFDNPRFGYNSVRVDRKMGFDGGSLWKCLSIRYVLAKPPERCSTSRAQIGRVQCEPAGTDEGRQEPRGGHIGAPSVPPRGPAHPDLAISVRVQCMPHLPAHCRGGRCDAGAGPLNFRLLEKTPVRLGVMNDDRPHAPVPLSCPDARGPYVAWNSR